MPFIKTNNGSPPWRILICGDRKWEDFNLISQTLEDIGVVNIQVVIEGDCQGADRLAGKAAEEWGIPVKKFPADWTTYGRAAGPVRNKQMLVEGKPNMVLAFHDDIKNSKGTANMIRQAKKAGLKPRIISHAS